MKKYLLTLLICVMPFAAWAATYYVDASGGDDEAAGTSTETAWKTITKVNASSFSPGDSILFKRGETWREQLTVPSSGSEVSPITITSYGSGDAPVISGSDAITDSWNDEGSNIWSNQIVALLDSLSALVIDGTYGQRYASVDSLDAEYNWYFDPTDSTIYLYSTADPGGEYTTIEYPARSYGIYANGKDYITIDGLAVKRVRKDSGCVGIYFDGGTGLTVQNCTISELFYVENPNYPTATSWEKRMGTGIKFDSCDNINANNNIISDGSTSGINIGTSTSSLSSAIIHHNNISNFNHCIDVANNSTSSADTLQGFRIYNNTLGNFGNYYPCSAWHRDHIHMYAHETGGGWLNDIEIYNNNFTDMNGEAGGTAHIYMEGRFLNVAVHHNIFRRPGGPGNAIWMTSMSYDYTTTHEIYNNVFYDTMVYIRGDYGTKNVTIKNNIFYSSGYDANIQAIKLSENNTTGLTSDYNLFYGDFYSADYIANSVGVYGQCDFAAWQAAGFDEHGINDEDPLFAGDPDVTDDPLAYQITTGSPAENAGDDVGLTADFWGTEIPQNGKPEIGVHELSGGEAYTTKYVNSAASPGGDGTAQSPYDDIQDAIDATALEIIAKGTFYNSYTLPATTTLRRWDANLILNGKTDVDGWSVVGGNLDLSDSRVVDPNNKLTVTADSVIVADQDNDEDGGMLATAFDASGNFSLDFDLFYKTGSGLGYCMTFTDSVGAMEDIYENSAVHMLIMLIYNGADQDIRFYEQNGSSEYSNKTGNFLTNNTWYYCNITKGSGGTYGTAQLSIYSDEARTAVVDTLALPLHADYTLDSLMVVTTRDINNPSVASNYTIANVTSGGSGTYSYKTLTGAELNFKHVFINGTPATDAGSLGALEAGKYYFDTPTLYVVNADTGTVQIDGRATALTADGGSVTVIGAIAKHYNGHAFYDAGNDTLIVYQCVTDSTSKFAHIRGDGGTIVNSIIDADDSTFTLIGTPSLIDYNIWVQDKPSTESADFAAWQTAGYGANSSQTASPLNASYLLEEDDTDYIDQGYDVSEIYYYGNGADIGIEYNWLLSLESFNGVWEDSLFTAGNATNIIWSSTGIDSLIIQFSSDGGSNWTDIARVLASDGAYEWTPDTATSQGIIQLISTVNENLYDESDGVFVIEAAVNNTKQHRSANQGFAPVIKYKP